MTYQREFERRINIGVVGVGFHCYRNILPCLTFLPVRLLAVCDLNAELAKSTAEQYGCRAYPSAAAMYDAEPLDAVFLCVGPALHPELANEAFHRGLHVWMEKPPAVRAAEVRTMIAARGDRIAVVGFKKAFMPSTQKVVDLLADDSRHPITTVLGQYPIGIPVGGLSVLDQRQPSGWLNNGCHPLSLMMRVGGAVRAVTTYRTEWDDGLCVLEYESGAIGNLHMTLGAGSSQPSERYSVYANGCTITIENSQRVTFQRGVPFDYGRSVSYAEGGEMSGAIVWEPQNTLGTLENMALYTQGFYAEMEYFCQRVLHNEAAAIGSLEFALEVMKAYEAAQMSDGTRIELSLVT